MATRHNTRDSEILSEYLSRRSTHTSKKEDKSLWGRVKKAWQKCGLDKHTVIQMIKGGLAPTIAVAIYQATDVADEFTTLGYLLPIVSIYGFPVMPRAKFIQMFIVDLMAVCIGTCFALLTMLSSVKARQHTESGSTTTYNSSASAVTAVWLFFQIWMVHTFRAKYPQFQFPVIIYSFFANIAAIYAPQEANMTSAFTFVLRLLKTFLTGLALSAGVSLFLFPNTSRKAVFKQMAGYINSLRTALDAHAVYFLTLESDDMFGRAETYDSSREKSNKKGKVYSPEAEAIRVAIRQINDMHAKLHGDLTFAKREFALGRLGPDDLQGIFRHLRQVMIPVTGLGFVVDIFQRLSEYNRWNPPIDPTVGVLPDGIRESVVRDWNEIMRAVHDPFATIIQTIDEGLLHTLYVFRLAKPPKRIALAQEVNGDGVTHDPKDVEAETENRMPGEKGFAKHFEKKLAEFRRAKRIALETWAEEKGISLPPDFFDHPASVQSLKGDFFDASASYQDRSRRQLYLFLYMEQLLYSTGQTVLTFILFADEVEAKGKLSRIRLVIPGFKRCWKWAKSFFDFGDNHEDGNMGDVHTQSSMLELGEAYRNRKDPEHLPPTNWFQKCGDKVRMIPRFLRSFEASYGFRVACATMTIAVVAFLHDTQHFFTKQRLVWAMIMPPGVVYPGQKTPGIIVFLFIALSIGFYVPIKMLRFRPIGLIGVITTAMIIGYELSVRKVGEAVATSNGQAYYPIYVLAPYRLATVSGGIAVAFFWTFFPYPISEHSVLRQNLGASLYYLANYYSIIHETIMARMRGEQGDMTLKTSAGRKLEKARGKVFSKQMLMLNSLRTYSGFLRWEVPIGGKFPKDQYDAIILWYASDTMMRLGEDDDGSGSEWLRDLRRLVGEAQVTTHEVTTLLCLLSASITNRQPLPPYLKTPRPYSFSKRLEALDKDILSIQHIAEPGFAAFAVLQISTRCIVGDVDRLMRCVRDLVGELDFSFHTVTTTDGSITHSRMASAAPSRVSVNEAQAADRDKTA
ncbi:hypothetical protein N7468_002133 [Penicillium chermesinum]|uniref:ER transporter 6TM N-terminal domain-containing protein n=1 Tax=Penicillium chermesinum TaxID=63820 RepID=A0A9W9TXB2_9EURO|nr:uncharacterized protein N7468_002133 [Penicillium chermesinum]KAJ5247150.1 hypothetical protein N7468_002133 [Penicillium chermesinum]